MTGSQLSTEGPVVSMSAGVAPSGRSRVVYGAGCSRIIERLINECSVGRVRDVAESANQ